MIWAILFLGFGLRLVSLNQSLWLDEAISALAARDYSFWDLVNKFPLGDTHPPLYYLLLKAWTGIFGYSEVSLRVPSVIFGLATVAVVYLIAKKLGRTKTGLIAASLAAAGPLLIYYSQEVRMYALSTLLVSLAVWLFLQEKWFFFAIDLLVLALTDYLPLLALPIFWIFAFFKGKNSNFWKKFLLAHLPLAIFIFFWFPVQVIQGQNTRNYLQSFSQWATVLGRASFKELSLVWIKFIMGRISFSPQKLYFLVVAVSSLPFIYAFVLALKSWKKNLLFWLWLVLPVLATFVGSIIIPGFSYFRLIFVLPAFYILAARGLSNSRFSGLLVFLALTLNLIFSAIYLTRPQFQRENWRGAVGLIESRLKDDEVVLMAFPEPFAPYRWYASRPDSARGDNGQPAEVKKLIRNKSGLYSLDYLMDLTDPMRATYQELQKSGFSQKEVFNFQAVGQVRYWVKR